MSQLTVYSKKSVATRISTTLDVTESCISLKRNVRPSGVEVLVECSFTASSLNRKAAKAQRVYLTAACGNVAQSTTLAETNVRPSGVEVLVQTPE